MNPMRFGRPLVALGLAGLLAAMAACGNEDEAAMPPAAAADAAVTVPAQSTAAQTAMDADRGASAAPALSAAGVVSAGAQDAGIWVAGSGAVAAAPDIAEINLGVNVTRPTVSEARQEAAAAMAALSGYLTGVGVAAEDIRTQQYSIYPRYEYQEVFSEGVRRNERMLVGYEVSNTARVTLRDIDGVGEALDGAIEAAGDLVVVNGISFRIEDPSALQSEARAKAVEQARLKAQELAAAAGVTLGRLIYLSDLDAGVRAFDGPEFAVMAADTAASTPISGGALEVRVTVRAVYDIEE